MTSLPIRSKAEQNCNKIPDNSMNYYSKHQEKAARIASQGILLMTPQEVLTIAAAMNIDGPNYAAEQRTPTKELAEHFREKCLQSRGKLVE